jgi:uncharacterized coiled-coil DUF342 family protein
MNKRKQLEDLEEELSEWEVASWRWPLSMGEEDNIYENIERLQEEIAALEKEIEEEKGDE